ncbi:MAG: DUF6596 domain-containing protein [Acidimicrobiia bacterium]
MATLIRLTGDWDLAEESTQDAFAAALVHWSREGIPRVPGAWLTTTARRRAIDRHRRSSVGTAKAREWAMNGTVDETPGDESGISDDRLRLIFTCCHPALALDARVSLTLRTLAGLTTAEIGRAFLVPEATMAKRIGRAKAKIRHAGIPYRVPPAHLLPERTTAVLAVVYLLFNEGYRATAGADLIRTQLCEEAIRLARALSELMPDEPEAAGLLALVLLHHARKDARVDPAGDLVPLDEQDRARWDGVAIAEGTEILEAALRRGEPGPYQVQAAIAACHGNARSAELTNWHEIVGLYDRLYELTPTPVVALNRAVAVGMADGPLAGLARVDELAALGVDASFPMLEATKADFLRRLGRHDDAERSYRIAREAAGTDAERRYLTRRLTEVRR